MKKITVMCDYSADGLWLDDIYITIDDLPEEVAFLKNDIQNWQKIFENFKMYNLSENECLELMNTLEFKNFLEYGLRISKELRNYLNIDEFIVEYYNEETNERILIN